MRKIYTSNDVLRLIKEGKKELYFEKNDSLTDVAKDLIKRHNIKLLSREEAKQRKAAEEKIAAGRIKIEPAAQAYYQLYEKQPEQPASWPAKGRLPSRQYTDHSEYPEEKQNDSLQKNGISHQCSEKAVYDMLIYGGTLVIPEFGELKANLAIKNGKIAAILTDEPAAKEVISAEGLFVLPGILDPHTHIGLMAPLSLELETEGRSALLGGVTTAGCFFNQGGSYLPLLDKIEEAVAVHSRIDLIPHLALREEIQLSELPQYAERGVKSYKMYMCGVPDVFPHQEDGFIFKAMTKLRTLPIKPIVCIHAENTSMIDYAATRRQNQRCETLEDWRLSHPDYAEEEAVLRAAYFGKKTEQPVYIVHVSSKEAINALYQAKSNLVKIETTSPYLTVDTASDIGVYGKMLPAFRRLESRDALWQAVRDGLVDTIGTDNVTMTSAEKNAAGGMENAMPGYAALATHLASVLDEGVIKRGFPLAQLVPLMTMNPAKIFAFTRKKERCYLEATQTWYLLIYINARQ